MNFKLESSGDDGVLKLGGNLTIEHAGEVKKIMIDAIKKSDHVTVSLEDVTAVDLSCLQLLCSAHRTALKSNKQLTLDNGDSDIVQQFANDAGYARRDSCSLEQNKDCLWWGGEK